MQAEESLHAIEIDQKEGGNSTYANGETDQSKLKCSL